MNDDYLWDRSGPPDLEIDRLERLLRPLAHGRGSVAGPSVGAPRPAANRAWRVNFRVAAAAGLLMAMLAGLLWTLRPGADAPGWMVEAISGTPVIGERPLDGRGRLRAGGVMETDASSRARIAVADIGLVEVDSLTRLELLHTGDNHHRLRLLRGTLHASIIAPPGEFIVETPSSTAVDLGCAYTLRVDDAGAGEVRVTAGWVGFTWKGRESFIPAGAMCQTRPGIGPGTPYFADAPARLQSALQAVDFEATDAASRGAALQEVLSAASAGDGLTLWHLLRRLPDASERALVYDRLQTLVPPPDGVTREGVLNGDQAMLDRWWSELSLGDIAFWRQWTQRWSEQGAAR